MIREALTRGASASEWASLRIMLKTAFQCHITLAHLGFRRSKTLRR